MTPILDEIDTEAKESVLPIHFAKVDATREKSLAKQFNINSFPTLLLFRRGIVVKKYEGVRTKSALQRYVVRITGPSMREVSAATYDGGHFKDPDDSMIVLYRGPVFAPFEGSSQLWIAFCHVAEQLKGDISFFFIKDETILDGSVVVTEGSTTKDSRTVHFRAPSSEASSGLQHFIASLSGFVTMNNYPLLTKFDSSNFKKLGDILGRRLVFLVTDAKVEQADSAFRGRFENVVGRFAADHEHNPFVFGYLDGVKFSKYMEDFDDGTPSHGAVIVLDMHEDKFLRWDGLKAQGDDEEFIAILTCLLSPPTSSSTGDAVAVMKPVAGQRTIARYFWKISRRMHEAAPWSYVLTIVPIVLVIAALAWPYPDDKAQKLKKRN